MGRRRRGGGQQRAAGRKLLINSRETAESRIAVLEGTRLEEYYIERGSLNSTLGNIYKARISNIEKSIGAAFVEFGHHRQGFLHVSDLCMAAVGENARGLLADVQAARENAHDDDVVDVAGTPGVEVEVAPASSEPVLAEELVPDSAGSAADAEGDGAHDGDTDGDGDGADHDQSSGSLELSPREGHGDEESDSRRSPRAAAADASADDEAQAPAKAESLAFSHGHWQDSDDDDGEPDADRSQGSAADSERAEADPEEGEDDEGEDDDDDEEEGAEDDDDAPAGGSHLASGDRESGDSDATGDASGEHTEGGAPADAAGLSGADGSATSDAESDADGGRRGRDRGRRGRRRGRRSGGATGTAQVSAQTGAVGTRNGGGGGRGSQGGSGGGGGRSREPRLMPPIHEILQKGQEIVVQVIKDGIGTKGPTLTTYLSIPGRFVVLMPGINKRGVSRKVVDNAERERLKDIVRELEVPEDLGFIVRTAGTGATREDLQRDLDYLLRLWDQMKVRIREFNAPVLLYQENDLVIRTLRDLYDGQGEIIIDDRATVEKAKQFMSEIMPRCVDLVRLYDGERPLFNFFGVEAEIAALLTARIELKSGGSLIIEQTEALVAIDVNSGRFKASGGSGIEDTAFLVNSEAAIEVARQIRLRDLGGVVVVDFIDMRSEKHRKALENIFKDALRRDRARIKVARISPFGIIELTRQRVRPSLKRSVHQKCPYCAGTGYIPSDETSCLSVIREIRENLSRPGSVLVVTVRPEVAEAVVNQERKVLVELEHQSRKQIFVRSDHRLAYEDVEIRAMVALPEDMDHRRA